MKRIKDVRRGVVASEADCSTASIEAAVGKFLDTDVRALVVYDREKRVRGATVRSRGFSSPKW